MNHRNPARPLGLSRLAGPKRLADSKGACRLQPPNRPGRWGRARGALRAAQASGTQ
jgi:hypothetical protein